MRKDVAIVIPLYKPFNHLDQNEKFAIDQMSRILKNRDIFLVAPEIYKDYPSNFNNWIIFDRKYFTYSGYSELCKSEFFYQTFLDLGYRYMCLVQQDVYIREDNLDYFLGEFDRDILDYIGAPWFGVWFCQDGTVGNGGFCIRRLETFRNICRDYPAGGGNEDVYFLQRHKDNIRVAPTDLALEFSWEEKPYFCYRITKGRLPMGTHGYFGCPDRVTFWRRFFPVWETKSKAGEENIYSNPNFEL